MPTASSAQQHNAAQCRCHSSTMTAQCLLPHTPPPPPPPPPPHRVKLLGIGLELEALRQAAIVGLPPVLVAALREQAREGGSGGGVGLGWQASCRATLLQFPTAAGGLEMERGVHRGEQAGARGSHQSRLHLYPEVPSRMAGCSAQKQRCAGSGTTTSLRCRLLRWCCRLVASSCGAVALPLGLCPPWTASTAPLRLKECPSPASGSGGPAALPLAWRPLEGQICLGGDMASQAAVVLTPSGPSLGCRAAAYVDSTST